MPNITEPEIMYALYHTARMRSVQIFVPHIHLLVGEQDLVMVTAAWYAKEYEIKVTRSDFYADLQKTDGLGSRGTLKHDLLSGKVAPTPNYMCRTPQLPREFWFVLPASLGIGPDDVPDHAGLILCERRKPKYDGNPAVSLAFAKPAPVLRHAAKLDDWAKGAIMRSLSARLRWAIPKVPKSRPHINVRGLAGTWPGEADDGFEDAIDESRHPERKPNA